ncbi:OsmC family protein [Negadavirga shengliensis]|uniref:OsmC family protein n=1 Tax=Negadavirga shengliensis TaxID=1389218 RepID=A0ABV9SYW8_9BACT
MLSHTYNISLTWKEGRKGELNSPELSHGFEVATPPQFDKGIHGIWSPEHLFTASISSCFMTTFLAIAEYSKLEYQCFDCKAEGILAKEDGKFLMTEVILKPKVKLVNEVDRSKAERIIQKAETACLISNSIKTKVTLEMETWV